MELGDAEIPPAHVLEALLLHAENRFIGIHQEGIQFIQAYAVIHGTLPKG
jgi:hypothetical protein